jgi:hypothetical protein
MVDEGWFVMSCDIELQDCNAAKYQLEVDILSSVYYHQ